MKLPFTDHTPPIFIFSAQILELATPAGGAAFACATKPAKLRMRSGMWVLRSNLYGIKCNIKYILQNKPFHEIILQLNTHCLVNNK
jgi:hypothetical protein